METTENKERLIVATSAACGVAAAYILASPLPENVKVLAVPILGLISVTLGAFWSKWVNPK